MEEFKIIPGYENYLASSFGKIVSLNYNGTKTSREMNQTTTKCGYKKISLFSNHKQKTELVHLMIARTFLNHESNGKKIVVNHIDNDKSNNKLSNLEVVSARYNNSCHKHLSYNKTSSGIGVYWNNRLSKWIAAIEFNGRTTHLGAFVNENDAINEYLRAVNEIESQNKLTVNTPANKLKSSIYKGVSYYKRKDRWESYVRVDGRRVKLGYFKDELTAWLAILNFKKSIQCK